MSERDENRRWLLDSQERHADGWEANMIQLYGIEGALDVLETQMGHPNNVNLTHRPFASNPDLKEAVYAAREAVNHLSRLAYEVWFREIEAHRARQKEDT